MVTAAADGRNARGGHAEYALVSTTAVFSARRGTITTAAAGAGLRATAAAAAVPPRGGDGLTSAHGLGSELRIL